MGEMNGYRSPLNAALNCSGTKQHFHFQGKTTLLQKNWHVILVKKTSVQLCPTASSKQMLHTVT